MASSDNNLFDLAENTLPPFQFVNGSIFLSGTPVVMPVTVAPSGGGAPFSMLFLMVKFALNPNAGGDHPRNVVSWYDVYIRPKDSQGIQLESTSPNTTEGATTITAGIGYSLSGNIGLFGATGTGGLGASVEVSKSESYSYPDLSARNTSHSDADRRDLRVRLSFPSYNPNTLKAPKTAQISEIEPAVAGTWKITYDQEPPAAVNLQLQLDVSYLQIGDAKVDGLGVAAQVLSGPGALVDMLVRSLGGKQAAPIDIPFESKQESYQYEFAVKLPKLPPATAAQPPQ